MGEICRRLSDEIQFLEMLMDLRHLKDKVELKSLIVTDDISNDLKLCVGVERGVAG